MKDKQLRIQFRATTEQFIETVRERIQPEGMGVFATWEACFRMAVYGMGDEKTAAEKLLNLRPYWK